MIKSRILPLEKLTVLNMSALFVLYVQVALIIGIFSIQSCDIILHLFVKLFKDSIFSVELLRQQLFMLYGD